MFGESLPDRDFAELERDRGIPRAWAEEACFRVVDEYTAREMVGHMKDKLDESFAGKAIPYFWPGVHDRVRDWRLRRTHPPVEIQSDGTVKTKDKYLTAPGGGNKLYFAPRTQPEWLEDSTLLVLLLEGEFKTTAAAVLSWHGLGDAAERPRWLTIGLSGVQNWRGKNGKRDTSDGHQVAVKGPIPDLDRILWKDRRAIILFDVDVYDNESVQIARNWFAKNLRSRGAKVFFADIPEELGVKGFDDVLGHFGPERALAIVESAYDPKRKKAKSADGKLTFEYGGGRFEVSEERGVEYHPPPDKDGNYPTPLWLASTLHIVAKTRDARSGEWGRYLRWRDADGAAHQWAMPMELLRRDNGAEVLCELDREGLDTAAGKASREYLPTYLRVWPADRRARCVNRLGWCNMPSHVTQYLLPTEVIGSTTEPVVFQTTTAIQPAFSVSGTAEEWKQNVAALVQGSTRLVFATSCGFAGPLLDIAGESSGGFHYQGNSSIGKTLAMAAGASVWGDPRHYCRTWRHTVNGLEAVAAMHNDGLLPLDELAQVDPKEAGEAAYLLANGQGKGRATRYGTARPLMTWRLLFLSAGEQSLASLMALINRKPTVGQQIRMAEIEADAGAGMGVVEDLHSYKTSSELMLALRDRTYRYHGAAGVKYLKLLVEERNQAEGKLAAEIASSISSFVEKYVTQQNRDAGGQVERVARRFALVGIAGELATTYGLTGWPKGEATTAAATCFVSWLNLFGGSGNREERQLLEQVRGFFETNGSSRFENMYGSDDQRIINRAGFYRVVETELDPGGVTILKKGGLREYLVLAGAFEQEVCKGFTRRFVVNILKKREWLVPGNERTAQRVRLPGMGPAWVYVFASTMWEGKI
jgi:uncharacterized protein (DUF927 family)